jgi:tetratricopeptide (TPR) repeat protein
MRTILPPRPAVLSCGAQRIKDRDVLLRWLHSLRRKAPGAPADGDAMFSIENRMREAYQMHCEGRIEDAERGYRAILEREPANADALYLLGEIRNGAGQHGEAVLLLERAIAANPSVAIFHAELGSALYAQGRHAEAAGAYASTLQLAPGDLAAHVNLGSALEHAGKQDAAEAVWRAALRHDPECLEAACNLASLLVKLGRSEEAQSFADLAVGIRPESFEAHMRRGDVLLERRQPLEAAEAYHKAHHIAPDSARALVGRGWALEIAGDVGAGLASYEAALAIDPEYVQAHTSRAGALLATERFGEGWDEYEWRLRAPEHAAFHERLPFPSWQGEPLEGSTVLFYGEQGLGDQILYASCVPDIMAGAAACHIECEPRLIALFRRSFPDALVHSAAEEWWRTEPSIDRKIAAASAPRYVRRNARDFPAHRGYLRADPGKVSRWQSRLQALGSGPKVGISWRGGVQITGRSWRSLALNELVPALSIPQAKFISVQYGRCEAEIDALGRSHGTTVHHWPEALDDYDETAALVCALDLIISVPTAIVHLAGALARPVWILAPLRSEARYGIQGRGMRWYPSATVYRQKRFGEWSTVLADVAADLRGLYSSR